MFDPNNYDVEAGSDDWQKSEWIRRIQLGLMARSGQDAGDDVPIRKLPAYLRKPVECYTPRQWQFGLHNRDPQASSSESEVLKISLAVACNLQLNKWDDFCANFVGAALDVKGRSYGIYSRKTELSDTEVQYLLTLDALTLVLLLSLLWAGFDQLGQLPSLFIRSLIDGGFNIEPALVKGRVASLGILDDLCLCENQIPMALMKKAISKCYGLLPQERKSNYFPELRQLENPYSDVTKELFDRILKSVAYDRCHQFFAEPCPDKKHELFELINLNYEVGKLENCAHVFACIHEVMTSSVGRPPIAVTTTFQRAKQLFFRAVATGSKQLANVIATIFGLSRETAIGGHFGSESVQSATVLKKAGLQIQGIPGMVQGVAFKNGCLFLPIMRQTESTESYICNMAAYEVRSTLDPYKFMDYLLLMTQLIKTPEDVSYLVDCDVIRPFLGTQERIFQMWQLLHVQYLDYSHEYSVNIVKPINTHCASSVNVMVTDFYNTFCSKPWLVISVISAIILLVATLIQTYVAIIGSDKMQPHYPRGG